ncbi:TonB-dependent receptor [bacterium]|nr:TonB-dependent receptor [bacterium]
MRPFTRIRILICILLFISIPLSAQTLEDLLKMDLEDILDMDMTVFSVRGLTQRQVPGVLTVIGEEEIRRSGSRDLIDVLRMVPGFDFGVDVQSAVSIGVRGLWAQEGKVLLLLDGIEMNEILFSCLALGDHFPVEHIQRVEIIRGPGSSFYGGYAELSVVNIVTKSAANLNGVEASLSYGRSGDAESRRSLALNFGRKFGSLRVKALSYFSRSLRSDRSYVDIYGNAYSMKDHSAIRPVHVNAGIAYKKLEASFLYDRYVYDQQDGMGDLMERPFDNAFDAVAGRMQYEAKIADGWTLSPYLTYIRQEPWKIDEPVAIDYEWYSRTIAERIKGGITLRGAFAEDLQVVAGGEAFKDRGSVAGLAPEWDYFSGGRSEISYNQTALFAQAFYTAGSTIPSLGLRFDRHSLSGSEFVPWAGVTQILGKWSLKALYGRTFRAPSLENLDLNPAIQPEKTDAFELEIGYQAGENVFFIVDLFRTRINGPIVYLYDPVTEEENYRNYRKVGSQGAEFELRARGDRGYLNANVSFYKPVDMIGSYSVPGEPGYFLGFSNLKASLSGHYRLGRGFSLNPILSFYGKRHGYASVDADSSMMIREYKPSLLANLCLQSDRVFGLPLDLSLGLYNALDADVPFIQPYDSGHAPLPSLSREVVLRARVYRGM